MATTFRQTPRSESGGAVGWRLWSPGTDTLLQVYPDGQDTISFEACESIGTLDCRGQERGQLAECTACSGPGGKLNNDLAIRIDYAEGPLGDTKANGVDKYLGLYKVPAIAVQRREFGRQRLTDFRGGGTDHVPAAAAGIDYAAHSPQQRLHPVLLR
eukprot:3030132-Rhodomonas_salina.1